MAVRRLDQESFLKLEDGLVHGVKEIELRPEFICDCFGSAGKRRNDEVGLLLDCLRTLDLALGDEAPL